MALTEQHRAQMRAITQRYPRARSAVMPMLHLAQSVEGYVSDEAIEMIASELGIAPAEVTAVSSFYTMYLSQPAGEHHVGVCTNTLCAVLGGDAIWDSLVEHAGASHHGTTPDGKVTFERIECQAACTHAPVMTADWEFMDQMTVESAKQLVDDLRSGREVRSTRGPVVSGWRATEATLAADEQDVDPNVDAPAMDDLMLAGLQVAKELGHVTPGTEGGPR